MCLAFQIDTNGDKRPFIFITIGEFDFTFVFIVYYILDSDYPSAA